MPFKSRLNIRRDKVFVNIVLRTKSGGQYSDSNLYTGLEATKYVSDSIEVEGEAGVNTISGTVFTFYPVNGSLPSVENQYTLVVGTDRYEIISDLPRNYIDHLKIITRKMN